MTGNDTSGNDRKWQEMTGNDTSGNVGKLWQKATSRMKLEKNHFMTKYSVLKKLSSLPWKVIPWTARAPSRSIRRAPRKNLGTLQIFIREHMKPAMFITTSLSDSLPNSYLRIFFFKSWAKPSGRFWSWDVCKGIKNQDLTAYALS